MAGNVVGGGDQHAFAHSAASRQDRPARATREGLAEFAVRPDCQPLRLCYDGRHRRPWTRGPRGPAGSRPVLGLFVLDTAGTIEQAQEASPTSQGVEQAEAAYERFVEANLPRNFASHFVHGMLGMTGFRIFNAPTFLPAYLHLITRAIPR